MSEPRFLAACYRRPVDRPPVWVMRQAGRYLPEYREVRDRTSGFLEMCYTPEIAAEVTLQPIRRYGMDAAIIFSDILTPLVPLGVELEFSPGPVIHNPVRTPEDVERLVVPEPWSGTEYLGEALERVRAALAPETALIGFCGAPWTLACYLVEGVTSKSYTRIKAFAHSQPEAFGRLLDLIVEAMASYLADQVAHGAQALQIFDSWLGALGPEDAHWALGSASRLLDEIAHLEVPRIYFPNGGTHLLDRVADMPCEVVGLDWRVGLDEAAAKLPGKAVQGNLDPGVLMGPPEVIRQRTRQMLERAPERGHIANLGHGITPDVPPEHLAAFVETIQGR